MVSGIFPSMTTVKTLLLIDNTAHHLYTQAHLYKNFSEHDYKIILCCPNDNNYFKKMQDQGYMCQHISMDSKGLNPIKELLVLINMFKIFKRLQPDLIFSFTIKPNIYSSLINKILKVPVVPNVTGLGYVFIKKQLILTKFIVLLYKFTFKNLPIVIFQNEEDLVLFNNLGISSGFLNLSGDGIDLNKFSSNVKLAGSGVDLVKFPYDEATLINGGEKAKILGNIIFLYAGRFLWDKGIGELVEAYKIVKNKYPSAKLKFAGNYYPGNPAAISQEQMQIWQDTVGVEYLGMVDDMATVIKNVDCVVLPSYREGVPRIILEASSMGCFVITTDTAGCRDTVDDNVTGFLCKLKDAVDLSDKMIKFIELPLIQKINMRIAGRKKMEKEFDQNMVINKYLEIAKVILK